MSDKVVVHLSTQHDFDEYKKRAKAVWIVWYSNLLRENYGEETCARTAEWYVVFANIGFYKKRWYRIISLEEAMKESILEDSSKEEEIKEKGEWFEHDYWTIEEPEQANVQKMQITSEFVRGEEVEVSDNEEFVPSYIGKYVCTIDHEYKYLVEIKGLEHPQCYKHIRKLPQVQEGTKKFTRIDLIKFMDKSKGLGLVLLEDFCKEHGMLEE